MFNSESMREFKFACPVCGQHITTDSGSSGEEIECPTCFRKIVVPQAPASADTKLILSAAQAAKPRPPPTNASCRPELSRVGAGRKTTGVAAVLLVLACAVGAAALALRGRLSGRPSVRPNGGQATFTQAPATASRIAYPVPSDIKWTLDLSNTRFPETVAAGSIHGHGFRCERATLQGGHLSLRQGMSGVPDLGVSIDLAAQRGEELGGKSVQIAPGWAPPLPRVSLRWKDDQQQPKKHEVNVGYALKLAFGTVTNARLTGRIYLCLPDESRSFVAGTFDAEIKQAPPPKPRPASPPL